MSHVSADSPYGPVVSVDRVPGARVVVVCEHASNRMPESLGGLGLPAAALESHIAWDPGAEGLARGLATRLGATLILGAVSRLVYDCNRPPEAPDAIPLRSEMFDIPGNAALPEAERNRRATLIHDPFHAAVAAELQASSTPVLVTVHSFTPIYFGAPRQVELGLLHGDDPTLAHAMRDTRPADLPYRTELNAPYGQADGVTYSIDRHGAAAGLPNVMLELRNDLLTTPTAQSVAARHLAPWIETALSTLEAAA